MAYIYIIRNSINDKVYIGKTNFDVKKRWQRHIADSKRRRNEKRPLYNAMNKYGVENFHISIIEECTQEDSSEREKYWINFYNSYQNGYNATIGGDGKSFIDYKKILKLYDTTILTQKEIAEQCNCSTDSVFDIVNQYRENVDWTARRVLAHKTNNLGIVGKRVQCVETGEIFESCTQAGKWIVENTSVKSVNYARNKIAKICKEHSHGKVGGYSWHYADDNRYHGFTN